MVLFPSLLHHLLILQRWHLPKRLNDLRLRYLQLGMVEKHTLSAKIEGGLSWRKKSKNAPEVEVDVTMLFLFTSFFEVKPTMFNLAKPMSFPLFIRLVQLLDD